MRQTKIVKVSCVEADQRLERIADGYKISAKLLRRRVEELEIELRALDTKSSAGIELFERLRILNSMIRTTSEIGREAEHYFEKGWWHSGFYTLNPRK